jgi:hypothetical protein
MLRNVAEVDFHAMRVSLKCKNGAISFYVFSVVFPIVSHECMIAALRHLNTPECVIAVISALYFDNNCDISINGIMFMGLLLPSGVRQGCPLSPLIFALCVDMLLRSLEQIPGITSRAFAGGIGTIIDDFRSCYI